MSASGGDGETARFREAPPAARTMRRTEASAPLLPTGPAPKVNTGSADAGTAGEEEEEVDVPNVNCFFFFFFFRMAAAEPASTDGTPLKTNDDDAAATGASEEATGAATVACSPDAARSAMIDSVQISASTGAAVATPNVKGVLAFGTPSKTNGAAVLVLVAAAGVVGGGESPRGSAIPTVARAFARAMSNLGRSGHFHGRFLIKKTSYLNAL